MLLEKLDVIENGRSVRRTTLDLILLTLRNRACEGDSKAYKDLEKLLAEFGPQDSQKPLAGCLIVPGRLTPADVGRLNVQLAVPCEFVRDRFPTRGMKNLNPSARTPAVRNGMNRKPSFK